MEDSLRQIKAYLEMVLRRKWLVAIPLVVGTVIAAAVAFTIQPAYRSTTVILVEKQQIPESYVTPTDRTPFTQRLSTIRQQIMSRQNLERIINEFGLYQKAASPGRFYSMLNSLGVDIKPKEASKEDLLAMISNDIEAKVIGDSGAGDALSVSFSGSDPYVTMQVTNKLASLFIEENLKFREQYAEGTSDFLANELEGAKAELEQQEMAVRNFKQRYMGSLPEQLDANLRTLDRLQAELQTATVELRNNEDRRLLLEAQMEQSRNAYEPSAGGAPANPQLLELRRLQAELSSLLGVYKDTYPDVVLTRKRINELKAQMTKAEPADKAGGKTSELRELSPQEVNPEVYNNLIIVKSQIATLRDRISDTRRQIKIFEKRVEEAPANEQKFADLSRDYNISLNNYQALLGKKLSANLAENLEKRQKGERFTVLDPANLPEKPYKPKKFAVTLIGTAVGAGVGVGLVFLLESLTPMFRTKEDLGEFIDMPVLAVVPLFASSAPEKAKRTALRKSKRDDGHT